MGMELVPDLSSFKHCTRARQTIANAIRTLADFLRKRLDDREAEECQQLMVKLAEDRFALAVVGQFKRGKSSLMNAIIGRDILPTGVLPLRSAITVLKYGPREKLTILRDGASYPEEVPVSCIAEHVTEKGNPGNAKKVTRAFLELPVQFLRRGLEFVDTPGIGSAIEANTATTCDFLPQSDAVIFVTSVDTPLTQAETDFLQSIQEHVRKIFFVVNKIDLAADGERQEIMEFISETLKRHVQSEELRIYPVSTAIALASTLAGEEDGYEKSGVKALQEALSDFLSHEKSGVLLVSVVDKALLLARKASRGMHLLKLAGEVSQEEIQEKNAALAERFESHRKARETLLIEIRERVISWAEERIASEAGSFPAAEAIVLVENLDETLLKLRWKPSFRMARHFARDTLQRLNQDLEVWTKQQIELLDPELLEMLRNEWARIEHELQRISVSAGKILGVADGDDFRGEEDYEPPINGLTAQPTGAKIEWSPVTSILDAFLPVFVVRSWIRKRLLIQMRVFIRSCAFHAEDMLLREVHHALNTVGSEMEKRAAEIESRIMQALQGKRHLKGVDGRRQVAEFNTEELAGDTEILAGIEKRLSSIRTQMLQIKADRDGELSLQEIQPGKFGLASTAERESLEQLVGKATRIEEGVAFADDLNTRGCAVCNRMGDAASHFFANWQYALSVRESAQSAYAASLGFCSLHTWQLEAMASPKGVSTGFATLMERLSADLSRVAASEKSNASESVRALVQDPGRCIVCRLVRDSGKKYLNDLAGFVRTGEGQKAYAYSQGVCLRHLGMLIANVPSEEVVRFLLDHAARRFLEISEDMRNYALKRDALRYHMLSQDEKDAYLRALIHTAGAKRVCFPWEMGKEV
jgi:predicted GTPase